MDILLERIIECIGPRHGAKKELAEHLGIHPNVITNWLNGRNKSYRRYVNEIAAFYGVSVDYLLGNADSKEKQPDSQNENQAVKDELIAFYGDVRMILPPMILTILWSLCAQRPNGTKKEIRCVMHEHSRLLYV